MVKRQTLKSATTWSVHVRTTQKTIDGVSLPFRG